MDDLVRNKAGRIVSKKKSALGKKNDRVKAWRESFRRHAQSWVWMASSPSTARLHR